MPGHERDHSDVSLTPGQHRQAALGNFLRHRHLGQDGNSQPAHGTLLDGFDAVKFQNGGQMYPTLERAGSPAAMTSLYSKCVHCAQKVIVGELLRAEQLVVQPLCFDRFVPR
jgi:hypothetical protein